MALAVTTSPAHADGAANSNTVTTASFNVPAGGMLVVCVAANTTSGGATTLTVTTSDAKTLTRHIFTDFPATGINGVTSIYTAPYPSAATGITVNVTTGGSDSLNREPSVDVFVVTGAHLSNPAVAVAGTGSTTNAPSFNPTSLVNNSMRFVCASDWQKRGVPVTATGFDVVRNFDQPSGGGISGSTGYKQLGTAGSDSYTLDAAGTLAAAWQVSRLELRPATAPTVDAGADASIVSGATFNRTATETTDGGQAISARAWTVVSGPASVGSTIGTAAALSWSPSTVGVYVLRYTATNSIGSGTDDVQLTVTTAPTAPTVNAGADDSFTVGGSFSRTATENDNGSTITSRSWTVISGPASVGSTLSTAAAITWTPLVVGVYVLRYSATNGVGTSTDDVTVTVVAVSSITGVPWLSTSGLGDDTLLAVEAAFGADLTDTEGISWNWTDITTDVLLESGINIKKGKGDEASTTQPATCKMTLLNSTGKYSLGGMSPYWPYIRRGTPIRVSVDLGDGVPHSLFQGYADGWSPEWGPKNTSDKVALSASGILRRLAQGVSPVISPMRRAIINDPDVVAYWPLEDGPNAQNIAAAVGPFAMTFYDNEHPGGNAGAAAVPPKLAASSIFACSDPLPTLNGSELYGHVGNYTRTGTVQVRTLISFPSNGATDQTVLIGLQSTGSTNISISSELWEVRYKTGGGLNVRGWARGSLLVDSDIAFGIDGLTGQLCLTLVQDGADIDWRIDFVEEGETVGGFVTGTLTAHYFGEVTRVQLNTDGANKDVVVGHVALLTADAGTFEFANELSAFDGDFATGGGGRIDGLCQENNIPYTQYGGPGSLTAADQMGKQKRAALVPLLRAAEAVDHGILWDGGPGTGLSYTTRRYRQSRAADLVLNANELQLGFVPVDDDQNTVNRFIATRDNGGSWTVEDSTGPMGTNQIGVYEDSQTFETFTDEAVLHFAGWAVGQGTREGYRYPQLVFIVKDIGDRVLDLVELVPGGRVDVTNISTLRPSLPNTTIKLSVLGISMRLLYNQWIVTLNAAPYESYSVGVLEADAGSPTQAGGFPIILDTDGSTLASGVAAGATSLSVATPTGPKWTTTSSDFPLTIDLGGVPVVVSAISGTSSPQTFTCAAVPKSFNAGTPIKVWSPTMLAI